MAIFPVAPTICGDVPSSRKAASSPVQNDAGTLKKDFNSSEELFESLKEDSAYWAFPGKTSKSYTIGSIPVCEHDLGGGISRVEISDGRKTIKGLTLRDMPLLFSKEGDNMFWELGPDVMMRMMQDAFSGTGLCDKWKPPDANVEIQQYPSGIGGSQFSNILFSDGRTFKGLSKPALPRDRLLNLVQAISENPPGTVPNNLTFIVVDKVGEIRGPDGVIKESGGVAKPMIHAIYLPLDQLETLPRTHSVIGHECCGHINDYAWGKGEKTFSQIVVDRQGKLVFGTGKFVPADSEGYWGDKGQSDFISEYSSRNAHEDFADTMALAVGGMKQWGHTKKFLILQGGELKRALKEYSPGLRRKLLTIIRRYRQEIAKVSALKVRASYRFP